jgi:hypothetical protein
MRKRSSIFVGLVAAVGLLSAVALAVPPSTADNMVAGEYLFPPQRIVAAGCFYRLQMQGDGNLVTYGSQAKWSAGTVNTGGYVAMQGDGNLVIRNWADQPVWNTGTVGFPNARLVQQSDGNLVIYNGGTALWWSGVSGESLGQEPCLWDSKKTQVLKNTDRLGGDFKDVIPTQARASWCGFFCAQESQCKAYTFVPAGVKDANPHCFLKNTVPPPTPHTGFVSGRVLSSG